MRQIVLIDNYDSFVYNLARYFERLGQPTYVVRNDALDCDALDELKPSAIVLSPGPCTPVQAGIGLEVVRRWYRTVPLLGVCLGHQTIAAALGAEITAAKQPIHGRSSSVFHDGCGIFSGAPNPLEACRYHSLVVNEATLPDELKVSARTNDGTVMALRHRMFPVVGVQFHPEAILTEFGPELLAAFLRLGGLKVPRELPRMNKEWDQPISRPAVLPDRPVTF